MLVSLTGADDNTDLNKFHRLALQSAFRTNPVIKNSGIVVEAGLLYYPEKMGFSRNPGVQTRTNVLNQQRAAAHLCGREVFQLILQSRKSAAVNRHVQYLFNELNRYERIQVNINARDNYFTEDEVHQVYWELLLNCASKLILQLHEGSAETIYRFLEIIRSNNPPSHWHLIHFSVTEPWMGRINILMDASRGKGQRPEAWWFDPRFREISSEISFGMAGGLTPENVVDEVWRFINENNFIPDWVDAETGIRTENELDQEKCEQFVNELAGAQFTNHNL